MLRISSSGAPWSIKGTGTAEHLCSACADGPRTAWVAGTRGTILKTEYGGDTWVRQKSGTGVTLRGITAVNANTVYIRHPVFLDTDQGLIFRTRRLPDGDQETWKDGASEPYSDGLSTGSRLANGH